MAQAGLAEAAGFDGVMTSEHHGGFPNYLPNPLLAATWALEATERAWAGAVPAAAATPTGRAGGRGPGLDGSALPRSGGRGLRGGRAGRRLRGVRRAVRGDARAVQGGAAGRRRRAPGPRRWPARGGPGGRGAPGRPGAAGERRAEPCRRSSGGRARHRPPVRLAHLHRAGSRGVGRPPGGRRRRVAHPHPARVGGAAAHHLGRRSDGPLPACRAGVRPRPLGRGRQPGDVERRRRDRRSPRRPAGVDRLRLAEPPCVPCRDHTGPGARADRAGGDRGPAPPAHVAAGTRGRSRPPDRARGSGSGTAAAVDHEGLAGHEARIVAEQEPHRHADVVGGVAQAAERDPTHHPLLHGGVGHERPLHGG